MKRQITKLLGIFLLLSFNLQAQLPQVGNDIYGEAAYDFSSEALAIDGNRVIIGASRNSGNGQEAGHIRVYEWNGGAWIQMGQDIDGDLHNLLGTAVAIDGNRIAVGAPRNTNVAYSAGRVRVYEWNGSSWVQLGQDLNGLANSDYFGQSVALDGNRIAIGADGNDDNGPESGHVRIYEWNGSLWTQVGASIPGKAAFDRLGKDISLDGNMLAVGGISYSFGVGAHPSFSYMRVYQWDGTMWGQLGGDFNSVGNGFDIGGCMDVDGNRVAVGVPYAKGDTGTAKVYEWDGTMWTQLGQDLDGGTFRNAFGGTVSLQGSHLVVGAREGANYNNQSFKVRVYRWDNTSWVPLGGNIEREPIFNYGGWYTVSMDRNKITIGNMNANSATEAACGRVRVYSLRGVTGTAYLDFNQNCTKDSLETNLANQRFIINPGNIIVQTDENGSWYVDSLPVGNYTITADTTNTNWQITCLSTQSFVVTNMDSLIIAPSFGLVSLYPCASPKATIHMPFLRPGFSEQKVYVQACNEHTGSEKMDSVYVVVELDSMIRVDSCALNYTSLGNNQYQVYLADSLHPGQCVNFWMSTTLSTNAVLGQSLCMSASLYPVDSCALDTISNTSIGIPCSTTYDNSHLDIRATCINNDSISFTIMNVGTGGMTCWSAIRLYIDGVLTQIDSTRLAAGQSINFTFPGDGRTWRMEADQHPLHPGNSQPSATIELCGNNANWTPNLVNILPHDDADPGIDIFCGEVRGSYDPNDKTGFPLGVGATHDILPNQKIEYLIRFQNTGTDTAFNVVIRDTLSADFDILSVQSGVSSHDYNFPNVWTSSIRMDILQYHASRQ